MDRQAVIAGINVTFLGTIFLGSALVGLDRVSQWEQTGLRDKVLASAAPIWHDRYNGLLCVGVAAIEIGGVLIAHGLRSGYTVHRLRRSKSAFKRK